MTYQQIRKEAIKTAVNLTDSMLKKDKESIELNTFKLNHYIIELLENLSNSNDLSVQTKKTM